MTQKVVKLGIKRKKGYLYYVDKRGDVSCAKMARGFGISRPQKLVEVGIKRKEGHLYFVDKSGDISVAKMARRGRMIRSRRRSFLRRKRR